ncbi:MAG: aspartate aminotransferase family protein [Lachnospiraceae bacterium]|jgi:acetylornithine/N-succinyldiaminopimelate aminotransferase|nr:aspartate aminotransferase family protein [Lachnospiraceae bacterium]MCI1726418.1 aspartate aminotransferase family protein [Lachnospiraceae bacterium]
MTTEEIKQQTEQYVLHTYNRFPIVIEKGEGDFVYDTDGKKYLDFGAGIAVFALGYHFPGFDEALKAQIDRVIHTSNLYYHVPLAEAAKAAVTSAEMSKIFFTNSGTEAIEGALKAARKYAYDRDGTADHEIIAMKNSFHGRTIGALSVTGNDHYQAAFRPLMGGVKFADFNDLESVKSQISDKTCAVIMETVQGEGGIYPAEKEFLEGVRALCDEHDMLLILDEIQCGMGRTGSFWAWQQYGVKPDIMTAAKALGCGVPVGAFLLNEKAAAHSLVPGDHGSTYGGNPFACAAVSEVFKLYESEKIVDRAKESGEYLKEKLDALAEKHSCIKEHRGLGLIRGLELDESVRVGDIIAKARERGLLILSAGSNVVRLVPPLVIKKEEIDLAAGILDACFEA